MGIADLALAIIAAIREAVKKDAGSGVRIHDIHITVNVGGEFAAPSSPQLPHLAPLYFQAAPPQTQQYTPQDFAASYFQAGPQEMLPTLPPHVVQLDNGAKFYFDGQSYHPLIG